MFDLEKMKIEMKAQIKQAFYELHNVMVLNYLILLELKRNPEFGKTLESIIKTSEAIIRQKMAEEIKDDEEMKEILDETIKETIQEIEKMKSEIKII